MCLYSFREHRGSWLRRKTNAADFVIFIRVERADSGEGESSPHHDREVEGEDSFEHEREREKLRERRHRSPGSEEPRKSREGEESEAGDEKEGEEGPSGMQVTIKADGERAVNSEGHVRARVSGRLFVELRCPHCPSQKSITFKVWYCLNNCPCILQKLSLYYSM